MKYPFFYSIFFLILSGLPACTGNHKNSSSGKDTTAVPVQKADTFFMKIKGEQASIIPGKSIGILKVGEQTNLIKIGSPQQSDAGMCKSLGRWFYGDSSTAQKELDIFSECDGNDDMRPHVLWIRTTDPAFKTKNNIGVGSSLQSIQSVFDSLPVTATYLAPDSTAMEIITAPGSGISFEMTNNNGSLSEKDTCRAIIVHRPERKVPALYFSFYKKLKIKD